MGFKQALIFHQERVSKGIRTRWVMHEYHLNTDFLGDRNHKGMMPFVVCHMKYKKDKKGAKASSSIHQDVHTIHTNNTPITIGSELDHEPISFATIPIETMEQLAENARSQGSSEEFWGSLGNIPMAPDNHYTGYWDDSFGTCPEVDNLWSN